MNTNVFALIFINILKIIWCFSIVPSSNYQQDGGVTEFPFAQAKVKYHRSRYCITAFGETNCVRMEEEPGNAAKLAKLYKIVMQGYEQNLALRTGQNVKPSIQSLDIALGEDINMDVLRQLIKPQRSQDTLRMSKFLGIKPKTNQNKPKFSKEIKPAFRELPKKMSQKVRLHKYITQKPYHVAPIPRRDGSLLDRSPFWFGFNPQRRVGVAGTYPNQKKL
ncbi:uncharacterized protein LOC133531060 [Cydia pomonella]|uniref:uncharacterized protein LOC133531060 n=1 Tax=Cydia pomonella TaxID=82600 RepID=UPI002ADE4B5E|nr:uncharacterized protein LOC133531060 [Cydia pomonella]